MADNTISAGVPLRFDIVADASQFNRTVDKTRDDFKAASREMAADSGGIGSQFLETAQKIGQGIGGIAMQMAEAIDKGAAGVEQGLIAGLNKVTELTKGFVDTSLTSLGEKYFGKLGERVGKAFATIFNQNIEPATKGVIEKLADNEAFTSWLDALVPKVDTLTKEIDGATNAAGGLQKRFQAVVEGVRSFVDVKLGRALPIEEFEAIVAVLDKEIARRERVIELIGKTAAEQAKLRMQWQLEDAGANLEGMGEKQKEKFAEKQAELEAAAAKEEGARKAEHQRQVFQQITVTMERQLEVAQSRNREGDKTLGQVAEERAIAEATARMKMRGRDLSAEELEIVKQKAAATRDATDAANLENLVRQSRLSAARAVRNSELEQALVGATPGETAAARAFAADLQRARETNLQLTAEVTAGFAANAKTIGEAAQAAADFRQRFQQIQEAGTLVARSLEDAFGKFIEGTKINFRDMAASLIADMAKLAFRQSVLQPLFGGGGSGAGLFANTLSGMFRADGGPVSSGQPYIVGEKRPELFIPQSAGTIVPQVPTGQPPRSTHLSLSIDARGSTADSVKLLEARLPTIILQTMGDARERGAFA